MTFWQNTYNKWFHSGSKIYLLIAVNIFLYLITRINPVAYFVFNYLSLPAYLPKLLTRFWTPLTYIFIHDDFFQVVFNMLWLYWMGQIFEDLLGNKRILGLYLLGGFAGALLYIAACNIFPVINSSVLTGFLTGSTASVMAIIVATAAVAPNFSIPLLILGPVKIKWIALFYVVFSFWGLNGPNASSEIANIGGALFGFIYAKQLQSGNDMIAFIANLFKARSKLRVASNNRDKNPSGKPRQEEIDRILDKISTTGYENLTKQEKEILFRASKNEG